MVYAAGIEVDEGTTTLSEITITAKKAQDEGYQVSNAKGATKTDMPILETPMAVQVIPKEILEDKQTISIQEAVKNVSGVQTPTSVFYDSMMIRGFSNGGDMFRNGLKSRGFTGTEDMAFVDQVEVVKGPSAMLYGRVQPGGLVNIVTKKPQAKSESSVQQQAGSWNNYRTTVDTTGAANANKTVLYRVMGVYDKGDSFIDYHPHDNKALAAYLAWLPSTKFDSNVQFEYYDNKDAGRGYTMQQIPIVGSRPLNVPRNWTQSDPVMWSSFPDTTKRAMLAFDWSYKFSDAWKLTHRLQYNNVDEVQTYLLASGYDAATHLYPRKLVSTPFARKTYSTNLDLTGELNTGSIKHNLLLGLDSYWFREDTMGYNPPYNVTPTVTPMDVFAPVYGNINPGAIQPLIDAAANNALFRAVYRDVGIYAQDQIALNRQWELLLGGRFDYAKNEASLVYGQTNATCYPNCSGAYRTDIPTEHQFSPRAGVLYKLSSEVSLYGSYSESFGNTARTSASFTNAKFDPERGIQYELGAKASLLGGKISTSATLFDLRLKNRLTPDLAHTGFSLAVGEVKSQGLELDVSGQVTDHVSVIGSYTLDSVTVTKDNTAGASNTVGKHWAGVPLQNASVWSKYDTAPGAVEGFTFGAGVYLNGQRQVNNTNVAQLPGYGRLDAMIGYRTSVRSHKVAAQLNAQNLTDKVYFENGDGSSATYGNPRNLMASVKVDF